LIAATARVHNLALATRNVADFVDTGIDVVNPWAGHGGALDPLATGVRSSSEPRNNGAPSA
jgi:hypothetical protein